MQNTRPLPRGRFRPGDFFLVTGQMIGSEIIVSEMIRFWNTAANRRGQRTTWSANDVTGSSFADDNVNLQTHG